MKNALTMRETADKLSITVRTLSAWVGVGRITPIPGTGGQGRTAMFDAGSVRALRENKTGVDFLARVRFAFEQDRAGRARPASPTCPPWISWNMSPAVRDYLSKRGRKPGVPDEIDLVPITAVPDAVKRWSEKMVKLLTEKEVRYLMATFYASEYPPDLPGWRGGVKQGSFRVLLTALARRIAMLWRYKPPIPKNMPFWNSISLRYNMEEDMFSGSPTEQRARLGQWVSDVVFGMIRGNDYQGLRRMVQEFAPKNRRILGEVIRYAKLENAQAKLKYAFPSPPAVASVLDITRMHGWRMWCGILSKIGRVGNATLQGLFAIREDPDPVPDERNALPCVMCGAPVTLRNGILSCSDPKCGCVMSVEELQEKVAEKCSDRQAKRAAGMRVF